MMRNIAKTLSVAAAIGMLAFSGLALAQQPVAFDGKKFFDDLQSRGYKAPAGFDGKKFFDDLQTGGYTSANKLDGKKFFERLQTGGYSMPSGMDAKKFWEEQWRMSANNMPPMVEAPK